MADGGDRRHASAAREPEPRTLDGAHAGCAPDDRDVLEQLRELGRELIDEPVPQQMLDILRAGQDPQD
jgi:hypothetical protein